MPKIHILGGSGSGKTTLAGLLASTYAVPHYDLDALGQRNGTDTAAWMRDIEGIVQQRGWITERVYLLLIDRFLYDADAIILLDILWSTAAWRIVRRHIIATLRGTNQYPGPKPLIALLRYSRQYYKEPSGDGQASIHHYLASRPREIHQPTQESLVATLNAYPSLVIPPTAAFVRQYLTPYQHKLVVVRTTRDRNDLLQRLCHTVC